MEKYNGWTNRETWLVALWINNEETTQSNVKDLLKQKFEFEFKKAEALKELVEDFVCIDEACLGSDLINTGLSNVDWKEIIESFNEN